MKQRPDSQACFDYLLDQMSSRERRTFEGALAKDDGLARKLYSCSEDLTKFVEGSVELTKPSDRVWQQISSDIRNNTIQFPTTKSVWTKRDSRRPSWYFIWPAAAGILLVLNLLQLTGWFNGSEESQVASSQQESKQGPIEIVVRGEDVVSEQQLQTLRDQIAVLQRDLSVLNENVQSKDQELEDRDLRLTNLEQEREALVQQIDNLEQNYLSLLEVASPVLAEPGEIMVQSSPEYVSVLRSEEDGPLNDIWSRVNELLNGSNIALLSAVGATRSGVDEGGAGGGFGALDFQESTELARTPDPYALAFRNSELNQTIVSLGNLPNLSDEQELHLWTRSEEGEGLVSIGPLPRSLHGSSGDVAAQLPMDAPENAELIISVEDSGYAGEEPQGDVLLRTQSPPEP